MSVLVFAAIHLLPINALRDATLLRLIARSGVAVFFLPSEAVFSETG